MPGHTPAKKAAAKRKPAASQPKSEAKAKAKNKPKVASVGAFRKPRNVRKSKPNGPKGKA